MRAANRELTFAGGIVVAPSEADRSPTPEQKATLVALHLRKIDLADRVWAKARASAGARTAADPGADDGAMTVAVKPHRGPACTYSRHMAHESRNMCAHEGEQPERFQTSWPELPPERQQIWPEYRMSHSLNVAWLDYRLSATQGYALADAWDVLVMIEDWREWVRTYLKPASPFLYLAVRDDVPQRRLRKTPSGASLQLPSSEVFSADADGTLVDLYLDVIHTIYTRWADGHGHPAPPELPDARSSP